MGEPILRRYVLKSDPPGHGGWAVFVIGSDGYFSTVSDYGNYSFIWRDPGCEFRRFLTQLEGDYFLSKVSTRNQFNEDKTRENVKDAILQLRRDGTLSRERAREEWEGLPSFESPSDFQDWLNHTELSDAWEYAHISYPALAQGFVNRVLPRFQALLRAELEGKP